MCRIPQTIRWQWGLLGLALLASGCGQQRLYGTLPEREANEIMAILIANDIKCTKEPGDAEETWKISVDPSQFSDAMEILNSLGRPRDTYANIEQLFPKTGLVSSPAEQRIRLTYGLEQSLAQTITQIPNVVSARVHLVLPNNDPLHESAQPSSASVMVVHRAGADVESLVPLVKQVVLGGVADLQVDAISVELVQAEDSLLGRRNGRTSNHSEPKLTEVLTIRVAHDSVHRLLAVLISSAAVFLIGLALVVTTLVRRRRVTVPTAA